jgi:hypothetical protein
MTHYRAIHQRVSKVPKKLTDDQRGTERMRGTARARNRNKIKKKSTIMIAFIQAFVLGGYASSAVKAVVGQAFGALGATPSI